MIGIQVDDKRLFGLDFLRALAIFFVVHGHGAFLLGSSPLSFVSSIPFPQGVDIFFVLSGFLIGKSLISYSDQHNGVLDARKTFLFYARSALRLLPNYLVILLVNYLLVQHHLINGSTDTFPLWRFATFTQNFCTPFYDFFWESWTLSVEWWFYICFPLLLFLFSKCLNIKSFVPILCLIMLLLSWIYRTCVASNAVNSFWYDVWIRKTVLSRTDNIYFGVLAAWVSFYFPKGWSRFRWLYFVVGVVLMALVILIPRTFGTWYANVLYPSLQPVAITLWLPVVTTWKSARTVVGHVVSHVSVLSYSMFLTNLIMTQILAVHFSDFISHHATLSYLVYWTLVMVASYLLYMLVEKPFLQLKAKIKPA